MNVRIRAQGCDTPPPPPHCGQPWSATEVKDGSFVLGDGTFTIYEAAEGTCKTADGKTVNGKVMAELEK